MAPKSKDQNSVNAVPEVQIHIHLPKRLVSLLPEWVKPRPREEIGKKYPPGKCFLQAESVYTYHTLSDLREQGFVPVRVVEEMRPGEMRLLLITLRKKADKMLVAAKQDDLYRFLQEYIWNAEGYRNPGPDGAGNIVIRLGRPVFYEEGMLVSGHLLVVNERLCNVPESREEQESVLAQAAS